MRLAIHPELEDLDGGGLIDERLLLFGIFPCLVQLRRCADSGVGFIDEMQRQARMEGLELGGKAADFLRRLAFSAIEMTRHAEDDGFDLALLNDGADAGERVLLLPMDRFHRVSHDAHWVRGGDADAGIAIINAQSGMCRQIAHANQSR